MKLEKILDNLNSFEKNSFLKVVTNIVGSKKDTKEIDKILSSSGKDLKSFDSVQIAEVFGLIDNEYADYIRGEFSKASSQFDLLVDIIARDGNCIMKYDWFARLYEKELKTADAKLKEFKKEFDNEKSDFEADRLRDYKIYRACLCTAYHNDACNNSDLKITYDEQSILDTLSQQLELSQTEKMLIKYMVLPVVKQDVDTIVNELKEKGIIFYAKKNSTIYVADEIVQILRKVKGKEVADKFFRRTLKQLREPQINLVCRKHNIDLKQTLEVKIEQIIQCGISFSAVLSDEIHRADVKLLDKRKVVSDLCDTGLKITPPLKGSTLDEKILNLVSYFESLEKDDRVSISIDGYEKLLIDLHESLPQTNVLIREKFELQEEEVMQSSYMLDYNIKPRDVLEIISEEAIEEFCKIKGVKVRGSVIDNILEAYKDAENMYIENYEHIGFRNLAALKENGILIKEADLGVKFEELTKTIFGKLGFVVDEKLRKKINTAKDQTDILLNLGNNEVILIECKTSKESGFNKFSSISRQVGSYKNLIEGNGLKIVKILIVAPDFSDDFITDCSEDFALNMSLLKASSLIAILDGFKKSKHQKFPVNLLMKDVLIQEERILKAISK